MPEIVFENAEDLFDKIGTYSLDPLNHKPLMSIYLAINRLRDPNVCSCKKGKGLKDSIVGMYMSLPPSLRVEPYRTAVKEVFGDGVLVFKVNGLEFARIE